MRLRMRLRKLGTVDMATAVLLVLSIATVFLVLIYHLHLKVYEKFHDFSRFQAVSTHIVQQRSLMEVSPGKEDTRFSYGIASPKNNPVFIKMFKDDIYMYSAVAGNMTTNSSWNMISIIGVFHARYVNNATKCCFLQKAGYVLNRDVVQQHSYFKFSDTLHMRYFICSMSPLILPVGVTIATERPCPKSPSLYLKPTFPLTDKGNKIAICAKIAFGKLLANLVIEWLEIHRYLGVDKVLVYTDITLNNDTRNVFAYYEKDGLVQTIPFKRAGGDYIVGSLSDKISQTQGFKHLVVFDCQERLRGYKYISILDFDEFIIPNNGRTWTEMLEYLYRIYPSAIGFKFETVYYVTSWGRSNPHGEFYTTQYLNRTDKPSLDREKNIWMPERLPHGVAHTHWLTYYGSYKHYRGEVCPPDIAVMRHYRACRSEWMMGHEQNSLCFSGLKRVTDTLLIDVTSKISNQLRNAKKHIFIEGFK